MSAWRKLCVAATILALVSPLHAKEDKKEQGGFFGRVRNLFSRDPNNTGGSKTPNETSSSQARQGFDTPSKNPAPVKPDTNKTPANAADLAKAGNKQIKKEELDRARRYPAIGKEPPSPMVNKRSNSAPAGNSQNKSASTPASSGNKSSTANNSSSGNKSGNSNDKNKK